MATESTQQIACDVKDIALADQGMIERKRCAEAMQRYGIAAEAPASWSC